MKFKCKRCDKFINVENENLEETSCSYCGTVHSWLYENGWGYYEKNYMKKKCPICKDYSFIKRDLLNQDINYFKITCDACNNDLFVKKQYNKVVLVPYNNLLFACGWCGEQIQCSVEIVNSEYLKKQSDTFAKHIETCKCPKCNNRTRIEYFPALEDKYYTERVSKLGRKKKIKNDVMDNFINNDFLYNRYRLLHPYNIIDFCDYSHYDYEQVFNYIADKKVEIFISLNKEEVKALHIKKFEKHFEKLTLK